MAEEAAAIQQQADHNVQQGNADTQQNSFWQCFPVIFSVFYAHFLYLSYNHDEKPESKRVKLAEGRTVLSRSG